MKEINPETGKPFKTGFQIEQDHAYGQHKGDAYNKDCRSCVKLCDKS